MHKVILSIYHVATHSSLILSSNFLVVSDFTTSSLVERTCELTFCEIYTITNSTVKFKFVFKFVWNIMILKAMSVDSVYGFKNIFVE